MPHVSRHNLSKNAEKHLIHALNTVFSKLTKSEEVDEFLISLMSQTERLMFAKRLAIIVLLQEGFTQVDISRTLHVTRETVSRIELLHETKKIGYILALRKLEEEKTMKEFKKILNDLAKYSIRAAGGYVKV